VDTLTIGFEQWRATAHKGIGDEGYIKIALNHWASSSNLCTSKPAFKVFT
jgi:hypothetical protein